MEKTSDGSTAVHTLPTGKLLLYVHVRINQVVVLIIAVYY